MGIPLQSHLMWIKSPHNLRLMPFNSLDLWPLLRFTICTLEIMSILCWIWTPTMDGNNHSHFGSFGCCIYSLWTRCCAPIRHLCEVNSSGWFTFLGSVCWYFTVLSPNWGDFTLPTRLCIQEKSYGRPPPKVTMPRRLCASLRCGRGGHGHSGHSGLRGTMAEGYDSSVPRNLRDMLDDCEE